MFGGVKMFCRMLVLRRIAAADMPTHHAQAQVNPAILGLQAFFAPGGVWDHFLDLGGMCALNHVPIMSVALGNGECRLLDTRLR